VKPYYQDESVTIYHGDCREVLASMPSDPAAMLVTDPPYGKDYQTRHRSVPFPDIVGDLSFDGSWVPVVRRHLSVGSAAYCFASDESLAATRASLQRIGRLRRMLVWDKGAMTGGDLTDYGSRTEYIVAASVGVGTPRELRGERGSNLIAVPRVDHRRLTHPAEKPVALLAYLIVRATELGEIILDPFMGSGPSLEAAKSLGRKAIGIEIDERYCEVAANRCRQGVLGLSA
jgi:DNA modification methylase